MQKSPYFAPLFVALGLCLISRTKVAELVQPTTMNAVAASITDSQMEFIKYAIFTAVQYTLTAATFALTRQFLAAARCPTYYYIRNVKPGGLEKCIVAVFVASCLSILVVRGQTAVVNYAMCILAWTYRGPGRLL